MSENQKRLLQQALDMLEEQALHIEAPMLPAGEELLNRIRAAISQQVEPAPSPCPICDANEVVELRTKHCLKCDADFAGADEMSANKAAVLAARAKRIEPAPAQDEREAFEAEWVAKGGVRPGNYSAELDRYVSERVQGRYEGWKLARIARPAQTEQQPVLSNCLDLAEKMTVSVDVSTGDDDAFNRLFCKVAGVQEESDGSWTILAVDPEPNFAALIAQTGQPGQSEELAWKVLQAATDALDRRAAPHAWISQAWNAGSEEITSRRPVAGGRDE